MPAKVLYLLPAYSSVGADWLREQGFVVEETRDVSLPTVKRLIRDAHGVVVTTPARLDAEILEAAPNLIVATTSGYGYDNIDLEAATRHGVAATNNPGGGRIPVSEHTIGLMICLSKDLVNSERLVREMTDFNHVRANFHGVELEGKTVGIIGLGDIGREVARKCRLAFHMTILAYDPFITAEQAEQAGARLCATLEELLPQCDYVTCHPSLTPSARGLIGSAQIRMMKPTAYLINTSRGPVVKERDLAAELEAGTIAGAAIDVYSPEPPAHDNPLLHITRNLILTPHTAGITEEAGRLLAMSGARQVAMAIRGERPPHLLNPDVWPHVRRFQA